MKKLVLSVIVMLLGMGSISAQSPSYVDWELDVLKVGFATPFSDGVGSGLAFSQELRYNLKDEISLGLGWEVAAFGSDLGANTVDVGVSGSFILVGDYYLKTDSGTRPFVGLGLGSYSSGDVTISNGTAGDPIQGGSSFGFAPRIGYELGHGRIMAQYNQTLSSETSNYLSITLGLTLWGGYKG